MQNKFFRQGDVSLQQLAELPAGAVKVDGPVIVAYGEVTGHCHQVKDGAELFQTADGRRFLRCVADTQVEHDEHDAIALMADTVYEVGIQREYSPEAIRNVSD